MSFFGKLKGSSSTSTTLTHPPQPKKDPNAPVTTPLEKHLRDATGPPRADGSDKFFGFENYGSTCYCNSIIQCLYYSTPFRSHVINFPNQDYLENVPSADENGALIQPRSTSTVPYPNPASPARKQPGTPISPNSTQPPRPEESKDSPEYRKRMALQAGPVLDMVHDYSNRYGMDESLFTALKDIFDAIIGNTSRMGVVSPHKFLEILRRENEMFRSAMHQDAHEFLNLLLNQVVDNVEMFSKQHPALNGVQANGGAPEKSLNNAMSNVASHGNGNGMDTHWVHDLFEGLLTSETRCLTCENTSQRDEPFLDLSVDLSAHTSVTSCLRKFSEEEMLCERNKFHCDNCGGLQEAEKRMKIKRLPRVLALHLKRFKYTEDLQRLQKLFHRVVYPFHLRLFNTTEDADDPDRLYELYAVVVHIGGGPYHGHYVSIIKTEDRGWLLFDDELVEPVDKSYVLNFFGGEPTASAQDAKQLACAYVLFYQETTLEAVMKEQEMEGRARPNPSMDPTGATARTSETTDRLHTSPATAGAAAASFPGNPLASPTIPEESPLTHASTAPSLASPPPPQSRNSAHNPLDHSMTHPMSPLSEHPSPQMTKKEAKAAEKSAEKARKADEKAARKADEERRKANSARRVENWKRQEEELQAVLEASRQSAVDDDARRGTEGGAGNGGPVGGGPGAAAKGGLKERFSRAGSLSLKRGKSGGGFFGGGKEKRDSGVGAAAANGSAAANGEGSSSGAATREAGGDDGAAVEERESKRRTFGGLGRKKSSGFN